HGELIPLLVVDDFVAEREEIATELVSDWEKSFSKKFWPSRNAWFKKSLACLQSPFQRTIWCDLDCEIRGSIEPLFAYSEHPSGIALRREDPRESLSYPVYNSGVIVFQRNLPLIEEWARQSFEKNHEFCGDQDLLSHLIDGK